MHFTVIFLIPFPWLQLYTVLKCSRVGCGLWLWHTQDLSLNFFASHACCVCAVWKTRKGTLKSPPVHPFKASLTFKCMTEHLFADFSYSIAPDTYLWKQMMQMNRKHIHIWYTVDKKHLLFTKRKCHKFSWLFKTSRCSPRKRSICACRIACKALVFIGLYSFSFGFLKKGFLLGKPCL